MSELTFGQKTADLVAKSLGSWPFLIAQTVIIVVYTAVNMIGLVHFDPYPFILLNLFLSIQAAFSTPLLMMSNNRQSEIDRQNAKLDLDTNVKSESEIEALMVMIEALTAKVDALAPKP